MAIHSSTTVWKIRWTEPGRLQFMGSQRVGRKSTSLHFIQQTVCIHYFIIILTYITNLETFFHKYTYEHKQILSTQCHHKTICQSKPLSKTISSVQLLSRVQLFATPWTVACQAPLSMGFSRQQSWSELPFPSPGDLPNPGLEPSPPALQTDALLSEPPGKPVFYAYIIHM